MFIQDFLMFKGNVHNHPVTSQGVVFGIKIQFASIYNCLSMQLYMKLQALKS